MIIDSHCHIDGEQFDADRAAVIQRALDGGIAAMLNVGTGSPSGDSFEKTIELAEANEGVYAAVGIHPHDARDYDDAVEKRLIELAKTSEKVIAWGEIGLDFHYDHSPRDVQKQVFRKQIRLAQTLELPIIVHSRDAEDETLEILTEECSGGECFGGIMHCYAYSPATAHRLIELGFLISFAGNVTFKNADDLRDAAKSIPLNKLLVETDCPYLSPEPYRGKRNEPVRVVETAKFLASHRGEDFDNFAKQTTANFCRFFGIETDSL